MSRPRSRLVPERAGVCPVHGETMLRGHRVGVTSAGKVRLRWRCPACWTEAVRARQRKSVQGNS